MRRSLIFSSPRLAHFGPMHDPIPLGSLPSGQSAHVDQLLGRPDHVHRLEELGLRQGSTIEMVRAGSPCIVRLDGAKLCFRDGDMLGVLVRPVAAQLGEQA